MSRPTAAPEVGPAARTVGIEIDGAAVVGGAKLRLRGWVKAPVRAAEASGIVLYCLAGGGCSTRYFDTQVPRWSGYSMADFFVSRGGVVVAVDHPGIGRSDPVDDLYSLTPTVVAGCHERVAARVRAGLESGALVPGYPPVAVRSFVGVGHSMGGLLAVVQQARHRSFDALALLGHGSGLPDQLSPAELAVSGSGLDGVEATIEGLARQRFDRATRGPRRPLARGAFFTDSVPQAVRADFAAQGVPLLYTCGLTSMIPGVTAAERAVIDVPTFFGFGDHDLIDDYVDCIAQFRSLRDISMYVLADSGHCHNQASGRHVLWQRMQEWAAAVAPGPGDGPSTETLS
ncbi:MAG: alpha/beta hydrolase [Actinomycetota bacterium]|nr:alpha/beta hydrolase [Actinomycetota bacterium]